MGMLSRIMMAEARILGQKHSATVASGLVSDDKTGIDVAYA